MGEIISNNCLSYKDSAEDRIGHLLWQPLEIADCGEIVSLFLDGVLTLPSVRFYSFLFSSELSLDLAIFSRK